MASNIPSEEEVVAHALEHNRTLSQALRDLLPANDDTLRARVYREVQQYLRAADTEEHDSFHTLFRRGASYHHLLCARFCIPPSTPREELLQLLALMTRSKLSITDALQSLPLGKKAYCWLYAHVRREPTAHFHEHDRRGFRSNDPEETLEHPTQEGLLGYFIIRPSDLR